MENDRSSSADGSVLVAHIVFRLDIGGLETVLVNLINHLPRDSYRHVIITLTGASNFRQRIARDDVGIYCVDKQSGKSPLYLWRIWRLLRDLQPDIVHTYNLGTIETLFPAWLAGVRGRIHAEHGRDVVDLDGTNRKYIFLRRILAPFMHALVPVSQDLEQWLEATVHIAPGKISLIYNGVDTTEFRPHDPGQDTGHGRDLLIGTVGRLHAVKNHRLLIEALLYLRNNQPELVQHVRLAIIGEGPLHEELKQFIEANGLQQTVWLAGARNDIPSLLRSMHIFVLPSLAEGIAMTALEAMASGLPVIATRVGGNPELVSDGETGALFPSGDVARLAAILARYIGDESLRQGHGARGREQVIRAFSIDKMVANYDALYQTLPGVRH